MENRAATAWAEAQAAASNLADCIEIGDVIDYADADDMGEQLFRELEVSLRTRHMVLIDDGAGHEVRHEDWEEHASENAHLAARHWDRD